MYENILEVGIKIDLCYISSSGLADSKKHYVSQLLEINADKANISMPMENGRIIPVSVGEIYELYFYTKNGLYKIRAKVIERYRIKSMFIATVEFISSLKKYQRRQLFRLDCFIDITYAKLAKNEEDLKKHVKGLLEEDEENIERISRADFKPEDWKKAIVVDISGGGIKMTSEEYLESNSFIMLNIPMSNGGIKRELLITAKIISSAKNLSQSSVYEQRSEFVNISDKDKEFIIKYIFNEERKRRRKEKGLI